MAEDPVSIHQGHGTLAQSVVANAPEGMLIAPAWRRAVAYVFDIVLIAPVSYTHLTLPTILLV